MGGGEYIQLSGLEGRKFSIDHICVGEEVLDYDGDIPIGSMIVLRDRFRILGAKAVCCGESVRKAGDEELFQTLAQSNISNFAEAGVKKIVTTSPHCYYTFKNEYPELGGSFEIQSRPQAGTSVRVSVPQHPEERNGRDQGSAC